MGKRFLFPEIKIQRCANPCDRGDEGQHLRLALPPCAALARALARRATGAGPRD